MTHGTSAAALLRELRERQGQTLRSAASEIGVAASQLSRMERGERPIGGAIARKLSTHYGVPAEVIELATGNVPSDILNILRNHPEEIEYLRRKYGAR